MIRRFISAKFLAKILNNILIAENCARVVKLLRHQKSICLLDTNFFGGELFTPRWKLVENCHDQWGKIKSEGKERLRNQLISLPQSQEFSDFCVVSALSHSRDDDELGNQLKACDKVCHFNFKWICLSSTVLLFVWCYAGWGNSSHMWSKTCSKLPSWARHTESSSAAADEFPHR